jgi:O-antigen/teichoic acid export membrane protein
VRHRLLAFTQRTWRDGNLAHMLSGYAIYALTPALVAIAMTPIVISRAGAVAWGGLIIGQTIGAWVSVVAGYGWGYTGPSEIALMAPDLRAQFYLDSVVSRLLLFVVLVPVAIVLVFGFNPAHVSIEPDVVMAVAALMPALSGSWYFVGQGHPRRLLLIDMAPNLIATVTGGVVLLFGAGLLTYALIQAAGGLIAATGALVSSSKEAGAHRLVWAIAPAVRRLLDRSKVISVAIAVTASMYINGPILVVAHFATPTSIAIYGLAQKLQRSASQLTTPITQVAQRYVPSARTPEERRNRIRKAVLASTGIGLVMGVIFAAAAPIASHLLSDGRIVLHPDITIPLGLCIDFVLISGVVGLSCLTTLGRTDLVAKSTACGAILGVPLSIWWCKLWGPSGVAWAVAVAESAVTTYQLAWLRALTRYATSNGSLPSATGSS